jgi:type II secretory pathway pseudopilin PulG
VELLIVAAILGLLAAIAIPHYRAVVWKARAAEAIGGLNVIRVAVLNYNATHNEWPQDVNRGRTPPGLEEYLPGGFSFDQDGYVLDYDNWAGRNPGFIGLTVITDTPELGEAMLGLLGTRGTWTNGRNKFTWVLEWTR